MKRNITTFLFLLALLLAVTGCGMNAPPVETNKTVLTLATIGTDSSLVQMLESFNTQSENYIVEAHDYETYHKLFAALDGNDGPDLFFVSAYTANETDLLERCEDLTPFLTADPDFSAEGFVPGLYNGMLQNGSLLWLPFDFTILSYAVQPPVHTAGGPFTIELARQAASDRGESVFPAVWTRDMLLKWVSPYLASAYVDWDSMTCAFDSPDFVALLECLKEHPATFDDIPEGQKSLLNYISVDGTMGMFSSYESAERSEGKDYALLGLPNKAANGSLFVAGQCFGIFSSGSSKEAAWQFLRSLMGDEMQDTAKDLPAMQTALERRVEAKVQSQEITQSAADKLLALAAATTCVKNKTNELEHIIEYEAGAFFEGTHTAQETSKRLQQQVTHILANPIDR